MLQYIQLASPENNVHTKNYFGQFTAAMTKGMHMMIIFILYYVLSRMTVGELCLLMLLSKVTLFYLH